MQRVMRTQIFHVYFIWILLLLFHGTSCNGSTVEHVYDLGQPLNFVVTDSLYGALDDEGRSLYSAAVLHAAEALGTQPGWAGDRGHAAAALPSENVTVQITLGTVDCTGDRAGYVRWRPNNVLQVCPSMIKERNYIHVVSLIMHEMGHVVGANHVACDGESVMAPDLNCPTQRYERAGSDPDHLFWYSDTDVAEICRHTSGALCSGR